MATSNSSNHSTGAQQLENNSIIQTLHDAIKDNVARLQGEIRLLNQTLSGKKYKETSQPPEHNDTCAPQQPQTPTSPSPSTEIYTDTDTYYCPLNKQASIYPEDTIQELETLKGKIQKQEERTRRIHGVWDMVGEIESLRVILGGRFYSKEG